MGIAISGNQVYIGNYMKLTEFISYLEKILEKEGDHDLYMLDLDLNLNDASEFKIESDELNDETILILNYTGE